MKTLFGKKLFGLAVAMLSLAAPGALASEKLEVNVGHSQVIGPIEEMSTVIVGNDGVVSATLGGGGTIILTGKNLGATNLIVLDERGRELLASELHVVPLDRGPTTRIQIVRGVSPAQNFECAPQVGCAPAGGGLVASGAVASEADDDAAPEAPETSPEATPAIDETAPQEQLTFND